MYNNLKTTFKELGNFLILWLTQSFSSLGSAMTNFALVIWSYEQHGSALTTSLLAICSYAPYVLLSMFAGALSDRWDKKRTMLLCDSFAALCTCGVLALLLTDRLQIWHLYVINTLNGLMNTVQQPASNVSVSLLCRQKHYQKVSGLRSLSNSMVTILTPMLATALYALTGLKTVIFFDLITFATAFVALLWFVKIPKPMRQPGHVPEKVLQSVKSGLGFLKQHKGILHLILLLAIINFTASIFNSALPALVLSKPYGGSLALGAINTTTGIATLVGSLLVTLLPPPKRRTRVILSCLLFSMSTENFGLALGTSVPFWCFSAVLGWIFIPVMSANMDVLLRSRIPVDMQGRVYSARNSLQFFTIPLGYLCGGFLVDAVFEPFMATQASSGVLAALFGSGKGAGAALLFGVIGLFGALSCLPFCFDRHIRELDN